MRQLETPFVSTQIANLFDCSWSVNGLVIDIDVDSSNDERRNIWTMESIKTTSIYFYGPVSSHQLMSAKHWINQIY